MCEYFEKKQIDLSAKEIQVITRQLKKLGWN